MSIIIHHTDPQIDLDQVAALQKFYACDYVITDWNFEHIPERTLALLRMEDRLLCHLEQQPQRHRMISINTAFSEMAGHLAETIGDINERTTAKLREFLAHQRGEIFTMHDVIMFLEMNPDSDGTSYKIPSLAQSLEQLGCSKEHMIVFIPPPPSAPTQIKQRFVSREEIYT